MKALTALAAGLATLALASAAHAVPRQLNVQASLADPQGAPFADGPLTVTFRVYADATGTMLVWSEPQTVDVRGGALNALLPEDPTQVPLSSEMEAILANGAPLWLTLEPAGQEEQPPVPLVSVPYALTAGRALVASDLECDGCVDAGDLASGTASIDISGNAATSTNADQVDGHHAAATGANVVPVTDASGKLNPAVIPAGVAVSSGTVCGAVRYTPQTNCTCYYFNPGCVPQCQVFSSCGGVIQTNVTYHGEGVTGCGGVSCAGGWTLIETTEYTEVCGGHTRLYMCIKS